MFPINKDEKLTKFSYQTIDIHSLIAMRPPGQVARRMEGLGFLLQEAELETTTRLLEKA